VIRHHAPPDALLNKQEKNSARLLRGSRIGSRQIRYFRETYKTRVQAPDLAVYSAPHGDAFAKLREFPTQATLPAAIGHGRTGREIQRANHAFILRI
jgi:hypothetical protein